MQTHIQSKSNWEYTKDEYEEGCWGDKKISS